jgi:phosphate transport system protein
MGRLVHRMLRNSLDALVNYDAELARSVIEADDQVDDFNRAMYDVVKEAIPKSGDNYMQYVQLLSLSRDLERIADQASNIAEDVIYLVEGEIIRHRHHEDFSPVSENV